MITVQSAKTIPNALNLMTDTSSMTSNASSHALLEPTPLPRLASTVTLPVCYAPPETLTLAQLAPMDSP